MNTSLELFRNRFAFKPQYAWYVGCEREAFVVNADDEIVPLSQYALSLLKDDAFGYELSACQLESRVGPTLIDSMEQKVEEQQVMLQQKLSMNGLGVRYETVAPATMPLDVYPDPTGRYQQIAAQLPQDVLLAACRVAGTHFHIGMPDMETALHVYNDVIQDLDTLVEAGNKTQGERMSIYQTMAPNFRPAPYTDSAHMHQYYCEHGFVDDPRRCWHLIRISAHGTIEFRMFDNTDDPAQVALWGRMCYERCRNAHLKTVQA
ncbi:MAG: Glutamate-cysteine ligase family [Candidatus Parcubacteria bacterium]|jgi:gamma-glutamyl:cysteine ligase YbdK (ATP-grasp superfamily)